MGRRFVPLLLLVLLGVLHAQLWLGRGSVSDVSAKRLQLSEQEKANTAARQRNDQTANEVRDLQEGLDMVEEQARFELGMVKPNEVFVQVVPQVPGTTGATNAAVMAPAAPAPTR